MKKPTKCLDLGCGDNPRNFFNADEAYGIDIREDLPRNIKCADLAVESIPYEDDSFDYITAFEFIEHIPRVIYNPKRRNSFIELMNEVYRVLKPGGYFFSSTPGYPNGVAFRDPTHINYITEETFPLYFDNHNRWASIYGFTGSFKIISQEWRGPNIVTTMQKVPAPVVNKVENNQKISIFIPVFNGEKYIARTIESILAQTYDNFEIICIDDQSTDSSKSIIQGFAETTSKIKILQPPKNLGSVAKVLNYALPHMSGAYFIYSSQDDLFSNDWLEKLHHRAIEVGADAVIPDLVFWHEKSPDHNRSIIGFYGDRDAIISNREAVEHSLDWSIPGNALWNANLIKKWGFDESAINSDEYSVRVFFLHSNKIAFSGGTFFYRQDNPEAITKKISVKTFEYPMTQLLLVDFLRENDFSIELINKESLKAVTQILNLNNWLNSEGCSISTEEKNQVKDLYRKFLDKIKDDPMFSMVKDYIADQLGMK